MRLSKRLHSQRLCGLRQFIEFHFSIEVTSPMNVEFTNPTQLLCRSFPRFPQGYEDSPLRNQETPSYFRGNSPRGAMENFNRISRRDSGIGKIPSFPTLFETNLHSFESFTTYGIDTFDFFEEFTRFSSFQYRFVIAATFPRSGSISNR